MGAMDTLEASYKASSPEYLDAADVAKLVRKALRRSFGETYAGVRFSVRTSKYSGGASIDLRWTDGPTGREVQAVIGPYAGGGFDGSIDLAYSVSTWMLPDGSMVLASSSGTVGSRGSVPGFEESRPHPDARLVRSGAHYVGASREISDSARARIEAYAMRHMPIDGATGELCRLDSSAPWGYWGTVGRTSFTPDGMMHVSRDLYGS